jgi:hypothetical protein
MWPIKNMVIKGLAVAMILGNKFIARDIVMANIKCSRGRKRIVATFNKDGSYLRINKLVNMGECEAFAKKLLAEIQACNYDTDIFKAQCWYHNGDGIIKISIADTLIKE